MRDGPEWSGITDGYAFMQAVKHLSPADDEFLHRNWWVNPFEGPLTINGRKVLPLRVALDDPVRALVHRPKCRLRATR